MLVRPPKEYLAGGEEPRAPRQQRAGAVPAGGVPAGGRIPPEPAEEKKASRLNKAIASLVLAAAVVSLGDWPWNGGGNKGEETGGAEAGRGSVSLDQERRTAAEGFSGTDGFAIEKGETLYLLSRRGSAYVVAVVRGGTERETTVPASELERRTSR